MPTCNWHSGRMLPSGLWPEEVGSPAGASQPQFSDSSASRQKYPNHCRHLTLQRCGAAGHFFGSTSYAVAFMARFWCGARILAVYTAQRTETRGLCDCLVLLIVHLRCKKGFWMDMMTHPASSANGCRAEIILLASSAIVTPYSNRVLIS